MKIYEVFHDYDLENAFGQAITVPEILGVYSSKEKAYEIAKKYCNIQTYDIPNDRLMFGDVYVREMDVDIDRDIRLTAYWGCKCIRKRNLEMGVKLDD